jgi:opacity protein-like surface antigen
MTNKLAVSAGFLHTEIEVSKQFLSDFSYYNPGDTFGAGIEWKASNRFTVDLGTIVTYYADVNKSFTDASVGTYTENYKKHNLGFAVGLGYHFGGIK